MGTKFDHLTLEDRCRLCGMMEMGWPKAAIARRLGRDCSTVYREIARNRCVEGYRPGSAGRRAWARKLRGGSGAPPARACRGRSCHGVRRAR